MNQRCNGIERCMFYSHSLTNFHLWSRCLMTARKIVWLENQKAAFAKKFLDWSLDLRMKMLGFDSSFFFYFSSWSSSPSGSRTRTCIGYSTQGHGVLSCSDWCIWTSRGVRTVWIIRRSFAGTFGWFSIGAHICSLASGNSSPSINWIHGAWRAISSSCTLFSCSICSDLAG